MVVERRTCEVHGLDFWLSVVVKLALGPKPECSRACVGEHNVRLARLTRVVGDSIEPGQITTTFLDGSTTQSQANDLTLGTG
jgi:hypothetical protein